MLERSSSRQRRPPCKTNKGMSDEAADAAALTYLPTLALRGAVVCGVVLTRSRGGPATGRCGDTHR